MKGGIYVDWLDRMNGALNYVEENLTDEIDYEAVAKIACCSVYHFQRMFSFIIDVPLSEYIRRRRLTLAAFELQSSDIKIIDLATKYGYDSPVSFARAFQNVHGITPSSARDKGVKLKAYPRISFHITIKGDVEMNYRIEQAQETKVFGKSVMITFNHGNGDKQIEEFITQSWKNGLRDKIQKLAGYGFDGDHESKLLGIALFDFRNDGSYRFMLTADYPSGGVTDDFEVLEVPKGTWAVFSTTCKEDDELDTIKKIWRRLPEWFQTCEYEMVPNIPQLERCWRTKEGYLAEVWIPITKK